MNYSIVFSLSSFFYTSLIATIYFSKKRIKNPENKVYSLLIISNMIGLISEVLTAYAGRLFPSIPIIQTVSLRIINIYFLTWIMLFTYYVCIISGRSTNEVKKKMIIIYFIFFVALIFLPLKLKSADGIALYSYGICVKVLYAVTFGCIMNIFLMLLTNMKTIKKRKFVPILIYFIFGSLGALIQIYWPSLIITSSIESFVTMLMFHTIENPDIHILEELNIERDRADKANNAKTDFLSSMSHEIRTPLNAINGFSQLILEENNIDTIKEEARDIMAASQNLLEIVNGILDISKIEADKLEIVNVEYDPKKVFNDVAMLAKSRLGNKPVQFISTIAEDLPDYLNGDYTRIKQVTLNLLTNAIKYTKKGQVVYNVRSVKRDNVCRLIIEVKDTGIGIKKENINKLFSKFERFDKEENITIEGTGLGLAITKKLVDLMHGRIIADSIYGQGSIFIVVIDQLISDRKKEKVAEVATEVKKVNYDIQKVLVVDDNKVNLKVASKLLDSLGVKCDIVDSGEECINKINEGYLYNLILMDDMMPKLSGTETFKLLKQNPDFNIPVVALTANAIEGMREHYIKEGFNDYISKPIDKKELERVLNIYLS